MEKFVPSLLLVACKYIARQRLYSRRCELTPEGFLFSFLHLLANFSHFREHVEFDVFSWLNSVRFPFRLDGEKPHPTPSPLEGFNEHGKGPYLSVSLYKTQQCWQIRLHLLLQKSLCGSTTIQCHSGQHFAADVVYSSIMRPKGLAPHIMDGNVDNINIHINQWHRNLISCAYLRTKLLGKHSTVPLSTVSPTSLVLHQYVVRFFKFFENMYFLLTFTYSSPKTSASSAH